MMSTAPAKTDSIALGPALKSIHWIFTPLPSRSSNHPLPSMLSLCATSACACDMLGKCPTRRTVSARADAHRAAAERAASANFLKIGFIACVCQ